MNWCGEIPILLLRSDRNSLNSRASLTTTFPISVSVSPSEKTIGNETPLSLGASTIFPAVSGKMTSDSGAWIRLSLKLEMKIRRNFGVCGKKK